MCGLFWNPTLLLSEKAAVIYEQHILQFFPVISGYNQTIWRLPEKEEEIKDQK